MVCDMRVYALPDCLLLDVPAGTEAPIAEYLDRFLIMERAEIEDLTDQWALLSLQGPQSAMALATFLGDDVTHLEPWQVGAFPCGDETMYVVRTSHTGEDGFDLWVPSHCAAGLWGNLCRHRGSLAIHSVGWQALNLRRVEAGVPAWGEELDPSIVPLEARLDHAIHYRKGCYVGQEIIARIEARGHVNNLLAGFLIPGDNPPAPGSEIRHDGKKAGVLRTVVRSPRLGRLIGLGYLRRELQEPGTRVLAGEAELEVTALPFVPHDLPESYTMPPV
jgi:folate-binding protein YgfZ